MKSEENFSTVLLLLSKISIKYLKRIFFEKKKRKEKEASYENETHKCNHTIDPYDNLRYDTVLLNVLLIRALLILNIGLDKQMIAVTNVKIMTSALGYLPIQLLFLYFIQEVFDFINKLPQSPLKSQE